MEHRDVVEHFVSAEIAANLVKSSCSLDQSFYRSPGRRFVRPGIWTSSACRSKAPDTPNLDSVCALRDEEFARVHLRQRSLDRQGHIDGGGWLPVPSPIPLFESRAGSRFSLGTQWARKCTQRIEAPCSQAGLALICCRRFGIRRPLPRRRLPGVSGEKGSVPPLRLLTQPGHGCNIAPETGGLCASSHDHVWMGKYPAPGSSVVQDASPTFAPDLSRIAPVSTASSGNAETEQGTSSAAGTACQQGRRCPELGGLFFCPATGILDRRMPD